MPEQREAQALGAGRADVLDAVCDAGFDDPFQPQP